MANVFTDDEKRRIAENEKDRLCEEIAERHRELGLQNAKPLRNQSEYQQIEDLGREESHIRELMSQEEERRVAERERKRRESIASRPKEWAAERYRKIREVRAKEEFDKRRISL